jgi:hypothetical protein
LSKRSTELTKAPSAIRARKYQRSPVMVFIVSSKRIGALVVVRERLAEGG